MDSNPACHFEACSAGIAESTFADADSRSVPMSSFVSSEVDRSAIEISGAKSLATFSRSEASTALGEVARKSTAVVKGMSTDK